ncbi:hypothetical protein P152DRAFT_161770 [Eremomyces bilateralis CBS 781.70]|uniref:Uncharacterized protein n=1 Tax=Eremomyces bilateralis CBS 781.70 TaxID=1392243 RepID=A0A6G1FUC3_9PEZI|nr:uncharacterized protein P152DRAFT_161770 [Eremomyces bilateralis CBS 781.70]KAF1809363.1 hypothetical protein P152DRAFT_161770 [Eremomyces bilateralis CBS 781.70]
MVSHIKQTKTPPWPQSYHHLLMTFKELNAPQEGWDFFRWLTRQGVEYTSPEVYGAGIELVSALSGTENDAIRTTIAELLDSAIERFPDGFVKYHFQPNALLTDRSAIAKQDQESLLLLARATRCLLHHGLIQDGYLGLDTSLRLCPTSTPLIVVSEIINRRNVVEAYKVLMLRYRNGTGLRHTSPTPLISKINGILRTDDRLRELPAELRVDLIIACVSLARACLASGGSFNAQMCSSVIKSLSYIVGFEGADDALENSIFPLAQRMVFHYLEHELPSKRSVTPINALLTMAARMENKNPFAQLCNWLQDSGVDADSSTYMIMMSHAVGQQNLNAFQLAWEGLRDISERSGKPLLQRHWVWFVSKRSSFGSEGREFVASQFQENRSTIPDQGQIQRILNSTEDHSTIDSDIGAPGDGSPLTSVQESQGQTSTAEVLVRLNGHADQLLTEMVNPVRGNFADHSFPMSISPRLEPPICSDDDLRIIYDRLTSVPKTAGSWVAENKEPSLHRNGYTIENLRFQNWKTLTELLRFSSIFPKQSGPEDTPDGSLRAITETLRQLESSLPTDQEIQKPASRLDGLQARIEQWRDISQEELED